MRQSGTKLRTYFYRKPAFWLLACCLIILAAAISPTLVWPKGKGAVNANPHINPNGMLHGAEVFAPLQGGINTTGIMPGTGGIGISGQVMGGSTPNSNLTNTSGPLSATNQNGLTAWTFKDKLLLSQPGSNIVIKIDSPPKGKSTDAKAENQSQPSDNKIKMASGDVLIIMDVDMATPPEQIPKTISFMEQTQADIIYGSRNLPESNILVSPPIYRKFLGKTWAHIS